MTKRVLIIVSAIFLIMPFITNGQSAPGLLGKKLSVGYDLASFIRYSGTRHNKAESQGTVARYLRAMSYRHDISVDYCVARNQSVGITAGYFRTGYGRIDDVYSKRISTFSLGAHFRKYRVFRSGSIAPLGAYIEYKIFADFVTTGLKENPEYFSSPTIRGKERFITPGIMITWGKQVAMSKELLIDFGLEIGYVGSITESGAIFEDGTPDAALFGQHLVNFKIGFSWMVD